VLNLPMIDPGNYPGMLPPDGGDKRRCGGIAPGCCLFSLPVRIEISQNGVEMEVFPFCLGLLL